MNNPPRLVIIGGGFGGLCAARGLVGAPVSVTLIDKRNISARVLATSKPWGKTDFGRKLRNHALKAVEKVVRSRHEAHSG